MILKENLSEYLLVLFKFILLQQVITTILWINVEFCDQISTENIAFNLILKISGIKLHF